jgi:hypothetical protein
MAIYEISPHDFRKISECTFSNAGLRERDDLQRLLRNQIEVIAPNTLIIAEEFGQWEECNRRIDLLGVDGEANLVVIELKRTEDGGHMELQAIRYAAMISTMTFERAVDVYAAFLKRTNSPLEARASLLAFLGWNEPNDDHFAQDVRIVLASAEFSKELTTSVMWLNERGLNIQCIRIKPYSDNGRVLADVQQIIPLPEAEDYRVRLKEKQQQERGVRKPFNPDSTRYDVTTDGITEGPLPKRKAIFAVVRHLFSKGHSPEEIAAAVPRLRNRMFREAPGELNSSEFIAALKLAAANGGRRFEPIRFFCEDDELFRGSGKTYAFSNQWGDGCTEAMDLLIQAFPAHSISYQPSS